MSKMYLVMCCVGFLIITCIYLEPETNLAGLTDIFSLISANFGSAISLLIHSIQSFATDGWGVSAFCGIKSLRNFQSRMLQAFCRVLFSFLLMQFCLIVLSALTHVSLQPVQCLLISCRWLLRTVVVLVDMLLEVAVFLNALHFTESRICGCYETQLYFKLWAFHWNHHTSSILDVWNMLMAWSVSWFSKYIEV